MHDTEKDNVKTDNQELIGTEINKMTVDEMINEINKSDETVYNIMFRNAGYGFMLWSPARCGMSKNQQLQPQDISWQKGLAVERYYPTLREAAEATLRLVLERRVALKKGPPEPPEPPKSQLIKEGTVPAKKSKKKSEKKSNGK